MNSNTSYVIRFVLPESSAALFALLLIFSFLHFCGVLVHDTKKVVKVIVIVYSCTDKFGFILIF